MAGVKRGLGERDEEKLVEELLRQVYLELTLGEVADVARDEEH